MMQLTGIWGLPARGNSPSPPRQSFPPKAQVDPYLKTIAPISTSFEEQLRNAYLENFFQRNVREITKDDVEKQIRSFRDAMKKGWSENVHKDIVGVVYNGKKTKIILKNDDLASVYWDVTRCIYDTIAIIKGKKEEDRSTEEQDLLSLYLPGNDRLIPGLTPPRNLTPSPGPHVRHSSYTPT
ncbi:hypothetical protein H0H93_000730 [Arthromyces matolae]|nr:hypothetical protein H0H93_000730 [Arthromyces matolae]